MTINRISGHVLARRELDGDGVATLRDREHDVVVEGRMYGIERKNRR